MSTRIYLDANIYLDYCDARSDGTRPLQELSYSVFRRALGCEFEIVMSDWLFKEIRTNIRNESTLQSLIADLMKKSKLVYTKVTYREKSDAHKHENWQDALHAIVARRTECRFIVTRNLVDFLDFSDTLEPKLPEQL